MPRGRFVHQWATQPDISGNTPTHVRLAAHVGTEPHRSLPKSVFLAARPSEHSYTRVPNPTLWGLLTPVGVRSAILMSGTSPSHAYLRTWLSLFPACATASWCCRGSFPTVLISGNSRGRKTSAQVSAPACDAEGCSGFAIGCTCCQPR